MVLVLSQLDPSVWTQGEGMMEACDGTKPLFLGPTESKQRGWRNALERRVLVAPPPTCLLSVTISLWSTKNLSVTNLPTRPQLS